MNLINAVASKGRTLLEVCTRKRMTPRRPGEGVLDVYSKGGGLGDELMVLCAIQAAVRKEPTLRISFQARHHSLLHGAPGLEEVRLFDVRGAGSGITYAHKHPMPILKQMAAQLGVPDADDFALMLPDRPLRLPAGWPDDDAPKILVQISASDWTPNKQWPLEHWATLIESLPPEYSVIEVGAKPAMPATPRHPKWRTLGGQTTLDEYVSCFGAATLFIGPVSSGMHLAHAFRLSSIIIVGGYEAADFPYPRAVQLGSSVECAPCWLRTPCPLDRRCLREIHPEDVVKKIQGRLEGACRSDG